MTELTLERRGQADKTTLVEGRTMDVLVTPPITEDYWSYRVKLSPTQAIVGFPKFTTIGVGFAVEEDWNTNLPYTESAEEIFRHIRKNKGDDAISDESVIEAIRLVQAAAAEDRRKA